jgi:hypothetical protein
MASRIYINSTADDFLELAKELRRIAEIAQQCGETLARDQREFSIDGFNSSVEGLDSLTKLMGHVVGKYNARQADLDQIRSKIKMVQDANRTKDAKGIAQKFSSDAGEDKRALKAAEPTEGHLRKEDPKTPGLPPKKPRTKKS